MRLVAIDFETADTPRDSACAIGMAVIDDGRIILLRHHLIRPPRPGFRFTGLHGIGWADVAREPEFGEVWDGLRPLIAGADYLMAEHPDAVRLAPSGDRQPRHGADRVVFALQWQATPAEVAENALQALRELGAGVAGCVLTRVDFRRHATYRYGDLAQFRHRYKRYYID